MEKEKKYYIFEKDEAGGNSYKKYTYEEVKDYFEPQYDMDGTLDDWDEKELEHIEEQKEAWNNISNIDELRTYIDEYVNNWYGMHYHDYYIEEA